MARMQSRLSNNKKKQLKEMVDQASFAASIGRFDVCEQLCRRIDSLQPEHPNVANLRGIMCAQSGQTAAAIEWLSRAVQAAPRKAEFFVNLGKVYLDTKQFAEAATCYGKAIGLGNKSPEVQLCYSHALVRTGQHDKALAILKKLHRQQAKNVDILMGLFHASEGLDRMSEAHDYLQAILEIEPEHAEARAKLGWIDVQLGRFEEAEASARKTLATHPDSPKAYEILSYTKKFSDADDPDVRGMTELYKKTAAGSEDRKAMCFTLAKAMEQIKEYDRTFELLLEGNAIRHQSSTYDAQVELEHIEQIMEAYTPEVFDNASGIDDETPILIVGMPRCGSTLTEQILAMHPQVASRGECDFFETRALPPMHSDANPLTLERITTFSPEEWGQVGRTYLQHLRGDDTTARHITDKTLTNIREIGAIHCALPKAKIVHVRRHPLDSCVSMFKLDFQGHLLDFTYNLGELGYYYRMYLRLMQHWRDTLPAGAMYELDYERLVADQEAETRKLLDYCGLEWDESCLQFDKADNVVRTSSMAQVRQGMYTSSMAAWKRYEKHLEPLIRILGTDYGHPPLNR